MHDSIYATISASQSLSLSLCDFQGRFLMCLLELKGAGEGRMRAFRQKHGKMSSLVVKVPSHVFSIQ